MKVEGAATREDLQKRLKRIEGQVRGVQRMLDEDRDCHEIIQQLAAIRSAVQGASVMFMRQYASDCLMSADRTDRASREIMLDDLMQLLGKVP